MGLQSPMKWMKALLKIFKKYFSEHYYSGSKNYINFDNVKND